MVDGGRWTVVRWYGGIVYYVNYISTCMKDGDMKTRGYLKTSGKNAE